MIIYKYIVVIKICMYYVTLTYPSVDTQNPLLGIKSAPVAFFFTFIIAIPAIKYILSNYFDNKIG